MEEIYIFTNMSSSTFITLLVSAIGFMNGTVRILDSITLKDEVQEPFRYARDTITHVEFSYDSKYLATAVSFLLSLKQLKGRASLWLEL